jgi:hypothetical protein
MVGFLFFLWGFEASVTQESKGAWSVGKATETERIATLGTGSAAFVTHIAAATTKSVRAVVAHDIAAPLTRRIVVFRQRCAAALARSAANPIAEQNMSAAGVVGLQDLADEDKEVQ